MKNFKTLGITPEFVKGLNELGIINPTDIQTQVIPLLLDCNTDFVGQAQTGTGKTAAFGLPIIQQIEIESKQTQAIILTEGGSARILQGSSSDTAGDGVGSGTRVLIPIVIALVVAFGFSMLV